MIIKSANDATNAIVFCIKTASYTMSKYNQLKLEFDNNKLKSKHYQNTVR